MAALFGVRIDDILVIAPGGKKTFEYGQIRRGAPGKKDLSAIWPLSQVGLRRRPLKPEALGSSPTGVTIGEAAETAIAADGHPPTVGAGSLGSPSPLYGPLVKLDQDAGPSIRKRWVRIPQGSP